MTYCSLAACLLAFVSTPAEVPRQQLDNCNVVWRSPSQGSSGSMPLGNGDVGLNLWVEPDGNVFFYLSKTDAWSGAGRLLKLGRVRASLTPNPFREGASFRQTLRLREGEIELVAGPEGESVVMRIWVDALRPVVHVEAESDQPTSLELELGVWRNEPRALSGTELGSAYGMIDSPTPVMVEQDTILPPRDHRLTWYHRNETSCYPITLQVQGLDALVERYPDPLLHRTFGGCIGGPQLVAANDHTLRSKEPATRHHASIHVLTAQTPDPADWLEQLERLVLATDSVELDRARAAHRDWWTRFWQRSWIFAETPQVPRLAAGVTANQLPLRIGADSDGQNRFRGRMARASVLTHALSDTEVAMLARVERGEPLRDMEGLIASWQFGKPTDGSLKNAAGPDFAARIVGDVPWDSADDSSLLFTGDGYLQIDHDPRLDLAEGFTLEAWIAPDQLPGGGGRLIDKSQAGTANGYLLDTYPGNSLRSIVQAGTLRCDAQLAPHQWQHVAATYDPASDRQCLYVGGQLVAQRGAERVAADEDLSATVVSPLTLGYVLQRFINACAGRGAYPIKFNGSIFTVDALEGEQRLDADYRRWGGCYWFQNTRLPYWSMLHAGDFDLMQPLFGMYREALPLARERTRTYYGHEGAFFPETMYFWGTYNNDNYGWHREGKPDGLTDNTYIRYYWDGALELIAMMLDYYAITGDQQFLVDTLLPLARDTLTFYEQHYPARDAHGKIVIEPSQALETWQDATNPLPVVAGLHYVTDRLLTDLPAERVGAARADWQRLKALLPDIPVEEVDGQTRVLPAARFDRLSNSENAELYAIFPYRHFVLGQPDLEIGRATYAARRVKRTGGWSQDPIQAALLGLTENAAADTYHNFSTKHGGSRFPAFWGPNFDWIPDQDHGGVAMIALQRMLMQYDGDRILLLPAWPRAWNVDFKLHAPRQTTVHVVWRDQRLVSLEVQPPSRRNDVVVAEPR